MVRIVEDRVMETSTSTGTGNFTLAGAVTGFVDFDSVMANGDICNYLIEAVNASGVPTGEWETGTGTFNDTDTLVRTSVSRSSNSNALVNFSAGTKRVSLTASRQFARALSCHSISFMNDIIGATTLNLNSTTYIIVLPFQFWIDFDTFPATHYKIVGRGASTSAGATISMQVAQAGTPTTGIHSGGNDIVDIPNTNTDLDSGWLSIDTSLSGTVNLVVAWKGSTATVDISLVKPLQIMFKVGA